MIWFVLAVLASPAWSSPLRNAYFCSNVQNLCLERCPRPDQIADHLTNEPAKVIAQQHGPILDQLPVRSGLRLGQGFFSLNSKPTAIVPSI
jgi:hypothetical protein